MRNLIAVFLCLFPANWSAARTITVDNDAPADFNNIQAAIGDANEGDTVEIQPGTYTGPGNRDIDFKGKAITVTGTDPNDPNIVAVTIIDCNGTEAEPHRGFSFRSGEGSNSILSGLTIRDGFGPADQDESSHGGAIVCNATSPTIADCVFSNNSSLVWGGAIYNVDGNPTITRCTFTGNVASSGSSYGGWGGAICWKTGKPTITECTFANNQAHEAGGAIFERGGAGSIVTDCTFTNNTAKRSAGAIYIGGSMVVTNCSFNGNESAEGGAVCCYGYASPTVRSCRITGNSAMKGGGVYIGSHSTAVIDRCLITQNSVDSLSHYGKGGGIYCSVSSNALISNCIVSNNQASGSNKPYGQGGGLSLSNCPVTVRHCTIVNNTAAAGGGITCNRFAKHTIANCVVWANIAPDSPQINGSPSVSYSNVQGGYPGNANTDTDPRFVDSAAGDYHLREDSPCRDSGDPLLFNLASGNSDIDGEPRVMGPRTDRGADEFTDDVLEIPIMELSCAEFVFTAIEQASDPLPQILTITNIGLGTLDWQAHHDCSWLHLDPNIGQSAHDPNEVTLSIDTSTLNWGSYQCELTIHPETAVNGPQTIIVIVHIKRQTPLYVPAEYESIQQAINAAVPGDTIIVAPGTYDENIDFLGKNLSLTSVEPNDPNTVVATVIKGDGICPVVTFDGSEEETCHLSGFTITSENAAGRGAPGGGINGAGATAGITNCVISGNCSVYTGGGLSNCDGEITNCIITRNSVASAFARGGGLHSCDGPITNCTISYNTSGSLYGGGFGGGLYNCQGPITGCTIVGNSAGGNGGGLYNCDGPITNCYISDNYARNLTSESRGGGLYDCDGEVSHCTVTNNVALETGGGLYGCKGHILDCLINSNEAQDYDGGGLADCSSVSDCTIMGNSAGNNGGGISNCMSMTNCLIARNSTVADGGGLCSFYWLANCTLAGNRASGKGGAIYLVGPAAAWNCILWNNTATDGNEICLEPYIAGSAKRGGGYYSSIDVQFSDVRGGLAAVSATDCIVNWGFGNIDLDPCFADPETDDYHLKSEGWRWDTDSGRWTYDDVTSRCIDAGNPDAPLANELSSIPLDPNSNWGRNVRINMGVYGGTAEASIAPHGWAGPWDYNNDGLSNFDDFALYTYTGNYMYPRIEALADFSVLASFADSWLDYTTWAILPLRPEAASNPNPPVGALGIRLDPILTWQPGERATSHNVYFGTEFPIILQGNQLEPSFQCDLLDVEGMYFWRIDQVNLYGTTTGEVWSFTTCVSPSGSPTNPYPADTDTEISTNIILTWDTENEGTSQRVYFGVSNPPAFRAEQSETAFYPGILSSLETYYWRIDQVNGCGTKTGPVWRFTTKQEITR